MQRLGWAGFGGADPALTYALDTFDADLADLVAAQDDRQARYLALPDEDWWQRVNLGRYGLPLALGAAALLVILVTPSGGRG